MTDLKELQEMFKAYLFGHDTSIADLIATGGKIDTPERLEIYRNAYNSRIVEAIGKDYPKLKELVGSDDFELLAVNYIYENPSQNFSLNEISIDFANFVIDKSTNPNKTYLKEIATLERAQILAFNAADVGALNQSDVEKIPQENWPNIVFSLHPSVALCDFDWNTLEIYQDGAQPKTQDKKRNAIVWRNQETLNIHIREIQNSERAALDAIQNGAAFCDVCETIGDETEVASYLKTWLVDGILNSRTH